MIDPSAAPPADDGLRAAYEAGAVPVAALCRQFGLTARVLYRRARREGWRPRMAPRRRPLARAFAAHGQPLHTLRPAMLARLYELLARRIDETERRASDADTAERDVKLLAALAVTLAKLAALESNAANEPNEHGDSDEQREADRIRRELIARAEAADDAGSA